MTGRERLENLLAGRPVDRPTWTTLVDDTTRSNMPAEWREVSAIDFYRRIGCDIACFGNYGLPPDLCVPSPCRQVCPGTEETHETMPGGVSGVHIRSPWGNLRSELMGGHPTRYPVQTVDDLRVLKNIWLNTTFEEQRSDATETQYGKLTAALGDDGLFLHAFGPSPVQSLLEYEMGLEGFYGFLVECPDELAGLLAAMHAARRQEFDICARRVPCQAFMLVENTSTTMISPALYETYSLPQLVDYTGILHQHGKQAILHMCGHIRALLPLVKQTGADGINATTPPTVGNTRYEDVLDVMGEDTLLWGAILDPSVFQNAAVGCKGITRALDAIYTPRIRRSRFMLSPAADGLPTPVERFLAVRDWFLEQACRGR
ncbi:MAG: uroporphyrinogen decarboxylase family protein [Kiritimatiellae bacterium]|nr:uroporphyrinogen decarboxylase family protein [Kiritimatiellia bacterium]